MSDWQTYRLADFIPFTPEVYWRLIERINETFWPLHIITVALGIAALLLALRGNPRIALILLAPAWLASGVIFHLTFYAELIWVAPYFGWAFIIQAAVLLAMAVYTNPAKPGNQPGKATTWIGSTIAVLGLLAYPLIAVSFGSGPTHADTYGLHPDPSAITTLGILLIILRGPATWLAISIPLLWCLTATLTLIALETAWAVLPLAAGTVVATTIAVRSIKKTMRQ